MRRNAGRAFWSLSSLSRGSIIHATEIRIKFYLQYYTLRILICMYFVAHLKRFTIVIHVQDKILFILFIQFIASYPYNLYFHVCVYVYIYRMAQIKRYGLSRDKSIRYTMIRIFCWIEKKRFTCIIIKF